MVMIAVFVESAVLFLMHSLMLRGVGFSDMWLAIVGVM